MLELQPVDIEHLMVLMEILMDQVEEVVMVVLVQMLIQLGHLQHLLVIVDTMLVEVVLDGMVLIQQQEH